MAKEAGSAASQDCPKRWTRDVRERFLEILAEGANVTRAAEAVERSPQGAYKLRRRDKAFADGWAQALETALDRIEAVVIDRVINGVKRPVWQGGKRINRVEYSDALAMFILRRRRPADYPKFGADDDDGAVRQALNDRLDALQIKLGGSDG